MGGNTILLDTWNGPMAGAPLLDQVNATTLRAALQQGILEEDRELAAIRATPGPGTFADTILALENAGSALRRVTGLYGNWSWAFVTPEIRALRREMEPIFAARTDALYQDTALFARVRHVADHEALDPIQTRLVRRFLDRFEAAGAHLDAPTRARVAEINQRLSQLANDFNERVMGDEEELVTELDEGGIVGMPASWVSAARETALAHKLDCTYAVANTRSAVEPFLYLSPRRDLREKVWRTFYGRGELRDTHRTRGVIQEVLQLRHERSVLLGFATYAHYSLARTMAGTPDAVLDLLHRVFDAAKVTFERELAGMTDLAANDGISEALAPWDVRYYAEKARQRDHDINSEELQKHFSLERLADAMLWAATERFGWTFTPVDVPVPHPDIRVWAVQDANGADIGIFHFDPYARAGKRSGAWMSTYREQDWDEGRVPPVVLNTCNFLKPGAGQHALLSMDDARTLFHEFGHGMHGLASNVRYRSLAGTEVVRDFVEFPSQLNERWLTTPEILGRFCRHIETGEAPSEDLLARLRAAANATSGFSTLEFLASAIIDMELHLTDGNIDPDVFERETLARWGLPAQVVMRHRTPHFAHIFSGEDYAAGYYCYLWADTIVADAAEAFAETGWYDPALNQQYYDLLLSIGHTVDAGEAFRAFRGRDPDVGALLRHRGLGPVQA